MAGNLVKETADCCNVRSYTYDRAYWYAYPTAVARGDAGQLQTKAVYDFNTGLVREARGENDQPTVIHYYPQTLRHFVTIRPAGSQTMTEYGDDLSPTYGDTRTHSVVRMMTSVELDDTGLVVNECYFDGTGALARDLTTTPDGWATVDVEHVELQRVRRVSNPYYSTGANSPANPGGEWTTHSYDGLGRREAVTTPDGVTARSDFAGRVRTATDQAGRRRRVLTDALGRPERADEPDASGNLGPVDSPAQPTYYFYDTLDNLTRVEQGAQRRFWRYDSMGRLTHERQAEQEATLAAPDLAEDDVTHWTRRYEYDRRSRLRLTVDARGVRTDYTYDGLNRVQTVTYSDGTPPVRYFYDEARPGFFNRGRLTQAETAAGPRAPATSQEYDYDPMGRVAAQRQQVDRALYEMSYAYNGLGQVKSQRYPTGRSSPTSTTTRRGPSG